MLSYVDLWNETWWKDQKKKKKASLQNYRRNKAISFTISLGKSFLKRVKGHQGIDYFLQRQLDNVVNSVLSLIYWLMHKGQEENLKVVCELPKKH